MSDRRLTTMTGADEMENAADEENTRMKTRASSISGAGQAAVPIISTPLAVMLARMQREDASAVIHLADANFANKALLAAKNALWAHASENGYDQTIGEYMNRKNTNTRTANYANAEDIVVALQKLDRESKVPPIAADVMELLRAPPLRPVLRSTTPVESTRDDRIGHLEDAMRRLHAQMTEMMDAIMCVGGRTGSPLAGRAPPVVHPPSAQEPPTPPRPSPKGPLTLNNENTHDSTSTSAPSYSSVVESWDEGNEPSRDNGNPWREQRQAVKRRMRKARVITGRSTPNDDDKFKGVKEPDRHLFIYRVSKDCEIADIRAKLQPHCEVRNLLQMSHTDAQFRSFKLTVPESAAWKLLKNSFPWPHMVKVKQFRERKPRRQNGEAQNSNLQR